MVESDGAIVRLVLAGPLRLVGPQDQDLTPPGSKTQGVLALLGTSPDLSRSRRWLQDRLWSDRGPEQGAASLRQALSELRRALGPRAGLLLADRQKVALDRAQVAVVMPEGPETEFLEGIDVRDPEFADWLRTQRSALAAPQGPSRRRPDPGPGAGPAVAPGWRPQLRSDPRDHMICLLRSRTVPDALGQLEDVVIDALATSLRELFGLTVYLRRPAVPPPGTIEVTVRALDLGGRRRGVRVRAVLPETGELLWSGQSDAEPGQRQGGEDLRIVAMGNELIEALGDALTLRPAPGLAVEPLMLRRLALRKMWGMDPVQLAEADTLFAALDQFGRCALVNAWRGQLRLFRVFERAPGVDAADIEAARAFVARAIEVEPGNSMVLAVAAYVHAMSDDDAAPAAELALRGMRINPANPLACDSFGIALLRGGRRAEAQQMAYRVMQMTPNAPNGFWWDMGLATAAVVNGQPDVALAMARRSAARNPNFRPPLRYIVALEAARGAEDAARAAAARLAQIEPGFCTDRLARDPEYPITSLRASGLLAADRLRALGV